MASVGGNLMQRTRCAYFYDNATPCNKRIPGAGCSAIGGFTRYHAILGTSEHCIAVHPSDMCVALAALAAIVRVSRPGGERAIAFEDFHRLPGDTPHIETNKWPDEIITAVDLPVRGFAEHCAYVKVRIAPRMPLRWCQWRRPCVLVGARFKKGGLRLAAARRK